MLLFRITAYIPYSVPISLRTLCLVANSGGHSGFHCKIKNVGVNKMPKEIKPNPSSQIVGNVGFIMFVTNYPRGDGMSYLLHGIPKEWILLFSAQRHNRNIQYK